MPHRHHRLAPFTGSDKDRFWAKVDKNGPIHPVLGTRCWLWTAYIKPNGYGQMSVRDETGKWVRGHAHRIAFEIGIRCLKSTEQVCHRCDNPACVNYKNHLYAGSQAMNLADAARQGHMTRDVRGEKHPNVFYTDADVAAIRAHHPRWVTGRYMNSQEMPRRHNAHVRVLGELADKLAVQYRTTPAGIWHLWGDPARRRIDKKV